MRRRRPLARRIRLRHWPAAAGHRAAHVTASGRKCAGGGEGAAARGTAAVTGLGRDQKDVPGRIGQGRASGRTAREGNEQLDWLLAARRGRVFCSQTGRLVFPNAGSAEGDDRNPGSGVGCVGRRGVGRRAASPTPGSRNPVPGAGPPPAPSWSRPEENGRRALVRADRGRGPPALGFRRSAAGGAFSRWRTLRLLRGARGARAPGPAPQQAAFQTPPGSQTVLFPPTPVPSLGERAPDGGASPWSEDPRVPVSTSALRIASKMDKTQAPDPTLTYVNLLRRG